MNAPIMEGEAMNDTSTSPIIMGLLFVLRCLVPLGILFGVSYLLRRMELIVDQAEEEEVVAPSDEKQQQTPAISQAPKPTAGAKQKSGKKKPVTPKKKES
jgi:hypothetical protein